MVSFFLCLNCKRTWLLSTQMTKINKMKKIIVLACLVIMLTENGMGQSAAEKNWVRKQFASLSMDCLLYTSDAAATKRIV